MWRSTVGLIVILALSVLVAPLTADAQPPTPMHRIGVLWLGSGPPTVGALFETFRQALRDLGYVEGQNMLIEYRYAEEKPERLPVLAAELVRLPVDVIVARGAPATQGAKQATSTLPIVMASGGSDPVGTGLVASLARPGGNVTGVSLAFSGEFAGKWVELLKEALPQVSRVGVLWDPTQVAIRPLVQETARAAQALGLQAYFVEARGAEEFDGAFAAMVRAGAEALLALPGGTLYRERRRLVALAAQHRLPAIYEHREYVDAGGLMSYGPDRDAMVYRVAYYVDRILKGTKPADLPVEQPTKFELVLNLKTTKALGITFSPTFLVLADEVIQ